MDILKIVIVLSASIISFTGCMTTPSQHALAPYLRNVQNQYTKGRSIEKLSDVLNLSDADFNLAKATLLVCKRLDPSVDIDSNLAYLDQLSAELAYHMRKKSSHKAKVTLITNFLWQKGFFSPNPFWKDFMSNTYYTKWYLNYSSFTEVLKQKRGNCIGLSLLYLALAERLDLPIYGVTIPSHVFVRYDTGDVQFDIETTDEGTIYSDEDYITFNNKKNISVPHTYYFTNLTRKEMFGCYLLNVGALYFLHKKYDTALQYYLLAHKCNPRDPGILQVLSNTYLKLGHLNKSLKMAKLGLHHNPHNAQLYCQIGTVYSQFDRYQQALDAFDKAVNLNPKSANYWNDKGMILGRLNRHKDAVVAFNNAIKLNPNLSFIYCNAGISLYHLSKYNKSKIMFDHALKLNPTNINALYSRARLFSKLGYKEKALNDLKKAIDFNKGKVILIAQNDPGFESLKNTEEFKQLLGKLDK